MKSGVENALTNVFLDFLQSQDQVLACAAKENSANKYIDAHIAKIIESKDALQKALKCTKCTNDDALNMYNGFIKYFSLYSDAKYQMHIVDKCSKELIKLNVRTITVGGTLT